MSQRLIYVCWCCCCCWSCWLRCARAHSLVQFCIEGLCCGCAVRFNHFIHLHLCLIFAMHVFEMNIYSAIHRHRGPGLPKLTSQSVPRFPNQEIYNMVIYTTYIYYNACNSGQKAFDEMYNLNQQNTRLLVYSLYEIMWLMWYVIGKWVTKVDGGTLFGRVFAKCVTSRSRVKL